MTSEYFQRVRWIHGSADDPVVLWAHVVRGWEVRKVDEFADGSLTWADEDHESESTGLGLIPVPLPAEIAEDPQFVVTLVEESEFEAVWNSAREGSSGSWVGPG
jgi:hypothetical protein